MEELRSYVEAKFKERGSLPTYYDFKRDKMVKLLRPWEGSIVKAVRAAFPGRFELWEFGKVPAGYWDNMENVEKAVEWLSNQIRDTRPLYCNDYVNYGLHALYRNIREKYPDTHMQILRTEPARKLRKDVPVISRDEKRQRVRHYVMDFLERENRLPNMSDFHKDGISNYLRPWRSSHVRAINELFPKQFHPWEFGQVPPKFWQKEENIDAALVWLRNKVDRRITTHDFNEWRVRGLYAHLQHMGIESIADRTERLVNGSNRKLQKNAGR